MFSFQEYYDYLLSPEGGVEEIIKMIDEITTNKTEFFRDQRQFDYFYSNILPLLFERNRSSPGNKLNIWSAGCSTGEEPYTIAIVLSDFCKNNNIDNNFSITASDISTRVLDLARKGIYKRESVGVIPDLMLNKYFTKTTNSDDEEEYQVTDELKKFIKFSRFNLIDSNFLSMGSRDIIFCRNVIIYFDKKTQTALFDRFYNCIKSGGYLLIGSAESLFSITDKFRLIAPSVYEKID